MTVEEARNFLRAENHWARRMTLACYRRGTCDSCQWYWLQVDTASLSYDNAVALAMSGPRPSWRQRQARCWIATAAQRMGVAWA